MSKKRDRRSRPGRLRRRLIIGSAFVLVEMVGLRLRTGRVAGKVVVRCRQGHLFTTIWIPGASFKAVRLGMWRFQRCPVGRHWTLVAPVNPDELTDEERRVAAEHRDTRIP